MLTDGCIYCLKFEAFQRTSPRQRIIGLLTISLSLLITWKNCNFNFSLTYNYQRKIQLDYGFFSGTEREKQ